MGRPPIGKRAMSDTERHRRYMAGLRQRATAATPAPTPAPEPKPPPMAAPDGSTIRVTHLAMDPIRSARWLCQKLDELNRAQAFGDAYNQALADLGEARRQNAPPGC
jgi:hypothetical protein